MDVITLYNQFRNLTETGTEEEARKFLTDHFTEFPEDLRSEIAFAFFEEGLGKVASETKTLTEFQTQTADDLNTLEKLKRRLEDRLRVMELEQK